MGFEAVWRANQNHVAAGTERSRVWWIQGVPPPNNLLILLNDCQEVVVHDLRSSYAFLYGPTNGVVVEEHGREY